MGRRIDIGVYGARGLPSTYSGYETFLDALLPALVVRGHTVTIYCRKGEVPEVATYRGVRCVQLPAIHSKQLSTLSHGFLAAARARWANHDVVLVVNVANAISAFLLRASGGRVVLNTDGQEWLRGKWGPVAKKVFHTSARIARWSTNALVSDCLAMRDVYRTDFGSDSTVIPYCWTGLTPAPDSDFLESLGVRSRRYFVVAGRLVPENNISEIAGAYLASDLDHPLVVLGAGVGRSRVAEHLKLLSTADPRLVLAGHVEDRSVFAALIGESTAYVHGHSVGGINPSLLEAMGCGARVVSLDTPFNREALADAGDYFPDIDALVPALKSILSEDVGSSEQRRNDARNRARDQFALSDVTDAYESLLSEVASRSQWSHGTIGTRWNAQAPRDSNETRLPSVPNSDHTTSLSSRLRRRAQAGT